MRILMENDRWSGTLFLWSQFWSVVPALIWLVMLEFPSNKVPWSRSGFLRALDPHPVIQAILSPMPLSPCKAKWVTVVLATIKGIEKDTQLALACNKQPSFGLCNHSVELQVPVFRGCWDNRSARSVKMRFTGNIQAYLGHCVTPSNYGRLRRSATIDGATYYPRLAWMTGIDLIESGNLKLWHVRYHGCLHLAFVASMHPPSLPPECGQPMRVNLIWQSTSSTI
jgi:hypothetical protein